MLKKLFKRYGATVLFYGGLIAIFALGGIFGMYAESTKHVKTECAHSNTTSDTTDTPNVEAEQITEVYDPEAYYTEITVTATAYCPCEKCCGKSDGITATGTKATAARTIAVDPSVIPYGTNVIIDGVTYVAEDCGGAVKGNDIDIFFNTHEEALNFGRRVMTAYILN